MATKVFVYALEGEPEAPDLAGRQYSERAIRLKWLLHDRLGTIGQDDRSLEPGPAESWTLSPDGLPAGVCLREGVSLLRPPLP
jgi:hypothetical protein